MRLLTLATQLCNERNKTILWSFDLDTKMTLKAHIDEKCLRSISTGDIVDVRHSTRCKRQEIWVEGINGVEHGEESQLLLYLEQKAATPYAVKQASFCGNIAKIEEVLSVEKDIVKVRLYGFPKEVQYLQINDSKWKNYLNNSMQDEEDYRRVIDSLNRIKNKYCIVDYPDDNQQGIIQIAAMMVR